MPILDNTRYEIVATCVAQGMTFQAAALKAGYSEKCARTRGSAVAKKAEVKARIEELKARATDQAVANAVVNRHWLIEKLTHIATVCSQVIETEGGAKKLVDSTGANRALELIGKTMAAFTDKVESTSDVSVTSYSEEKLTNLSDEDLASLELVAKKLADSHSDSTTIH